MIRLGNILNMKVTDVKKNGAINVPCAVASLQSQETRKLLSGEETNTPGTWKFGSCAIGSKDVWKLASSMLDGTRCAIQRTT